MATRKLKFFEYADHSQSFAAFKTDHLTYFECANGLVFLFTDGHQVSEAAEKAAALALERMQYYLENEVVENASQAANNALIYANGFIYEFARKNPEFGQVGLSCSCMIYRDHELHYAYTGKVRLRLFDGKKIIPLSHDYKAHNPDAISDADLANVQLLGQGRDLKPSLSLQALNPLNGDLLLLASDGLYEYIPEKELKKILQDSMPVQTKALRMSDVAIKNGAADTISLQLLSFYNQPQTQRHFEAIKANVVKSSGNELELPFREYWEKPGVKLTLLIVLGLLLAYMFYDIFLYDPNPPRKPVREQSTQTEVSASADPQQETDESTVETAVEASPVPATGAAVQQAKVPQDVTYTVKRGDTWGKIYQQYGVCSWFIRNHEENQGRFDSSGNPIAGSRIKIPVVYSSRKSLNPDFYQEFGIDKTGSACEQVNPEFKTQVDKKIR